MPDVTNTMSQHLLDMIERLRTPNVPLVITTIDGGQFEVAASERVPRRGDTISVTPKDQLV